MSIEEKIKALDFVARKMRRIYNTNKKSRKPEHLTKAANCHAIAMKCERLKLDLLARRDAKALADASALRSLHTKTGGTILTIDGKPAPARKQALIYKCHEVNA